jgi:hypothetical protein
LPVLAHPRSRLFICTPGDKFAHQTLSGGYRETSYAVVVPFHLACDVRLRAYSNTYHHIGNKRADSPIRAYSADCRARSERAGKPVCANGAKCSGSQILWLAAAYRTQ